MIVSGGLGAGVTAKWFMVSFWNNENVLKWTVLMAAHL